MNQKYKLVKELYGMTSTKGLPLKSVALISAKLWEDKENIIDEFLLSGLKKMNEEDIVFVSNWKNFY